MLNDWNSSLPTARPEDSDLSLDEIQIVAVDPPFAPTSGVIQSAWEHVKEKPVEALLLSFLTSLFGGGGSQCSNPFSNIPSGGGGNDYEGYESGGEYGGNFLGQASDAMGGIWESMGMSPAEAGMIVGILGFVAVLMVVFWVLGSLVNGGSAIWWLRQIRGQDASLNHVTKSVHFLLPIMLTGVLFTLALVGGFLMLIIPAIIFSLGFQFYIYVIVDKNIGYVDALRATWRMTDGHKVDLLVLAIVLWFLNIAGLMACCVGFIVTQAVTMGAMATVYDRLSEPGNAYLEPGESVTDVFE